MIKLINRVTGNEMWVAEARLSEYLAAGHRPAAIPRDDEPTAEVPKRKRTTKKK